MEDVQQIAGKGIEGLEHCPPAFHFDVTTEEFEQLLINPEEMLRQLGLQPRPGISVTLDNATEGFSEEEGWRAKPPRGPACCIGTDGGVHCHHHW